VLEDGSRTDNRMGAIEITMPAGIQGPPQHIHRMPKETFLIVAGGRWVYRCRDSSRCSRG
jgi:hypothetical protein